MLICILDSRVGEYCSGYSPTTLGWAGDLDSSVYATDEKNNAKSWYAKLSKRKMNPSWVGSAFLLWFRLLLPEGNKTVALMRP